MRKPNVFSICRWACGRDANGRRLRGFIGNSALAIAATHLGTDPGSHLRLVALLILGTALAGCFGSPGLETFCPMGKAVYRNLRLVALLILGTALAGCFGSPGLETFFVPWERRFTERYTAAPEDVGIRY